MSSAPSPRDGRFVARARLRSRVVRAVTLGLAFVHTFPANKHLHALLAAPSLSEAWKAFGAGCAILLYLLPPSTQARAIVGLWRARRGLVTMASCALVLCHLVPASDHLPKLVAHPGFGDAWRGLGSVVAVVWFLLPLSWQSRALSLLALRPAVERPAESAA